MPKECLLFDGFHRNKKTGADVMARQNWKSVIVVIPLTIVKGQCQKRFGRAFTPNPPCMHFPQGPTGIMASEIYKKPIEIFGGYNNAWIGVMTSMVIWKHPVESNDGK
jgi:hypothetical protein